MSGVTVFSFSGTYTYNWDSAGRQTQVINATGKVTTFVYDALNRISQRQYANGAITSQIYDPAGNIQEIINYGYGGALVSDLTYLYDRTNHRRQQNEIDGFDGSSSSSSSSGPATPTITTWTYDANYQLMNEQCTGPSPAVAFNITHTYDPAGNRTQRNDGTTITTFTYSFANRLTRANASGALTTYINDAAGNRTQEQTAVGYNYFNWDAAGRMTQAQPPMGIVTITYNADGQRIAKQSYDGSATGFLFDLRNLLHEADEFLGEITKTFTNSVNGEVGDNYSESGSELYHLPDAQAATNAVMDDLGNVVARYQFHAFGQPSAISIEGDAWQSLTPDQWSAMTPELWAELPVTLLSSFGAGGQKQYYLDQDTGLLLLGMGSNGRYMDPATARFMTQDPIGLAGGDANLYRLTGNDPVNYTDASGHGDDDFPYDRYRPHSQVYREALAEVASSQKYIFFPGNSSDQKVTELADSFFAKKVKEYDGLGIKVISDQEFAAKKTGGVKAWLADNMERKAAAAHQPMSMFEVAFPAYAQQMGATNIPGGYAEWHDNVVIPFVEKSAGITGATFVAIVSGGTAEELTAASLAAFGWTGFSASLTSTIVGGSLSATATNLSIQGLREQSGIDWGEAGTAAVAGGVTAGGFKLLSAFPTLMRIIGGKAAQDLRYLRNWLESGQNGSLQLAGIESGPVSGGLSATGVAGTKGPISLLSESGAAGGMGGTTGAIAGAAKGGGEPYKGKPGEEIDPRQVNIYRGGDSFNAKPGEFKPAPDGTVQTTHGISVDTDPAALQRFGGANKITNLPPELKIIQRGQRLGHFEIVPRNPGMSQARYQELLNQINKS